MDFYVYLWLRENGTPYYVGKGSGGRAFLRDRIPAQPRDPSRIVLLPCRDEQKAFAEEKLLIAAYGRKDLGTGCLRNLTAGGDGVPAPSIEARKKIGEANKRRVWSEKSRRKKSAAQFRWLASIDQHPRLGKKNSKLSEFLCQHPRTGENNPNFGNHKMAGTNNPMFGKKRPDLAERNRRKTRCSL